MFRMIIQRIELLNTALQNVEKQTGAIHFFSTTPNGDLTVTDSRANAASLETLQSYTNKLRGDFSLSKRFFKDPVDEDESNFKVSLNKVNEYQKRAFQEKKSVSFTSSESAVLDTTNATAASQSNKKRRLHGEFSEAQPHITQTLSTTSSQSPSQGSNSTGPSSAEESTSRDNILKKMIVLRITDLYPNPISSLGFLDELSLEELKILLVNPEMIQLAGFQNPFTLLSPLHVTFLQKYPTMSFGEKAHFEKFAKFPPALLKKMAPEKVELLAMKPKLANDDLVRELFPHMSETTISILKARPDIFDNDELFNSFVKMRKTERKLLRDLLVCRSKNLYTEEDFRNLSELATKQENEIQESQKTSNLASKKRKRQGSKEAYDPAEALEKMSTRVKEKLKKNQEYDQAIHSLLLGNTVSIQRPDKRVTFNETVDILADQKKINLNPNDRAEHGFLKIYSRKKNDRLSAKAQLNTKNFSPLTLQCIDMVLFSFLTFFKEHEKKVKLDRLLAPFSKSIHKEKRLLFKQYDGYEKFFLRDFRDIFETTLYMLEDEIAEKPNWISLDSNGNISSEKKRKLFQAFKGKIIPLLDERVKAVKEFPEAKPNSKREIPKEMKECYQLFASLLPDIINQTFSLAEVQKEIFEYFQHVINSLKKI